MQYVIKLNPYIEEHLQIALKSLTERYELSTLPTFMQDFIYTYIWHTCSYACIFGWSEGIRYHEFYTEAEGYVNEYGADFQYHFTDVVNDLAQSHHQFILLFEDVLNNLRESQCTELSEILPDVLVRMLPPYSWYQILADEFYQLMRSNQIESITDVEFNLNRGIAVIQA